MADVTFEPATVPTPAPMAALAPVPVHAAAPEPAPELVPEPVTISFTPTSEPIVACAPPKRDGSLVRAWRPRHKSRRHPYIPITVHNPGPACEAVIYFGAYMGDRMEAFLPSLTVMNGDVVFRFNRFMLPHGTSSLVLLMNEAIALPDAQYHKKQCAYTRLQLPLHAGVLTVTTTGEIAASPVTEGFVVRTFVPEKQLCPAVVMPPRPAIQVHPAAALGLWLKRPRMLDSIMTAAQYRMVPASLHPLLGAVGVAAPVRAPAALSSGDVEAEAEDDLATVLDESDHEAEPEPEPKPVEFKPAAKPKPAKPEPTSLVMLADLAASSAPMVPTAAAPRPIKASQLTVTAVHLVMSSMSGPSAEASSRRDAFIQEVLARAMALPQQEATVTGKHPRQTRNQGGAPKRAAAERVAEEVDAEYF